MRGKEVGRRVRPSCSGVRRALDGGVDVRSCRRRQPRHRGRRVGCRLDERVLDGRHEPGRIGAAAAPPAAIGSISGTTSRRRSAREPAHSINATRTHEPAIRPAIAGASSSATWPPWRRRSGTAPRGTGAAPRGGGALGADRADPGVRRRRWLGRPPRRSSQGRRREDQARRAGGRRPAGPRSDRPARGRPCVSSSSCSGALPWAVCSVALTMPPRRRRSSRRPSSRSPRGPSRAPGRGARRASPRAAPARVRRPGSARGRRPACGATPRPDQPPSTSAAASPRPPRQGSRPDACACASQRPSAAMPMSPANGGECALHASMVSRGAARVAMRVRQLPYVALPASPRPGHSQLVLAGEAA